MAAFEQQPACSEKSQPQMTSGRKRTKPGIPHLTQDESDATRGSLRRDADVRFFLKELAALLLPAGITPKHFGELAKYAFVHAASGICRFRNGKVNQSRVAVMTGLTRGEVKKFLSEGTPRRGVKPAELTRAERVVSGWLCTRAFLDTNGRPKQLKVRGPHPSFVSLVRKFAGDVPYKAVLDELARAQLIKRTGNEIKLDLAHAMNRAGSSPLLLQLTSVLTDLSQIARQAPARTPTSGVYRLTLTARDAVELAIVRKRASQALAAMLAGLGGSMPPKGSSSRQKKKSGAHTLTITAFLSERQR